MLSKLRVETEVLNDLRTKSAYLIMHLAEQASSLSPQIFSSIIPDVVLNISEQLWQYPVI